MSSVVGEPILSPQVLLAFLCLVVGFALSFSIQFSSCPRVRRPLARPRQDHRDDDGRVRVRRFVRRPVPRGGTRHLQSHLLDVHHFDQYRLDEPDGGAGRQRHPDLADGEPRQEAGEAGGLLGTVGEGLDVEALQRAARSPDREEASREELHRDQVRVGDVDEVPPLEEALLQAYR
jgi:hypothetical protein